MSQCDGWCKKNKVYLEGRMKNARPTPPMLMKAIMLANPHATLFIVERKMEAILTGLSNDVTISLPSRLSILLGPLPCSLNSSILVLFPSLGDIVGERVVGVGCTEQSLNGEQDGTNLQSRRPVAYAG